jgi:hypothetical protein
VRNQLASHLLSAIRTIIDKNPERPIIVDRLRLADRKLFKQFLKVLPSTGSIDFIDRTNMAGFSFLWDELHDLEVFAHGWGDPEHEFHDHSLEAIRLELRQKIIKYLNYLSLNVWARNGRAWRDITQYLQNGKLSSRNDLMKW